MFHAGRWADVFINVTGDYAEDGLSCLKAMASRIKAVPVCPAGFFAARRLENILRESARACGYACGCFNAGSVNAGVEYAIRFITMLVEKKSFKKIDSVLEKIEKYIDTKKGVVYVTVESAFPVDSVLEEELKEQVARQLGAAEVKMNRRLLPELLGGYRLRVGGFYIDASLKRQVGKMTAYLAGG